ncbi:hypothetical protein KJ359_004756 [Pestalotiopsis sp. 9143b]|nr:hypothetical protein KJ359_004756 [Pestalotiopsis sp. 9143b]
MVYNWDAHEPKCYRLYIDEKKSLEEIMDIMRIEDNFTPSKRAYQTQFRRWNFPSKQNPAHRDARLVARVKELWEKNLSQKEILRILNDEDGFEIKHRELMRVRARNRWLLRTPNPNKTPTIDAARPAPANLLPAPGLEEGLVTTLSKGSVKRTAKESALVKEPLVQWEARKARRRGRSRQGSPSWTAGQPRFPSETTIDQSRVMLDLDVKLYQELRAHFSRICDQEGVSRKTIAGPEKWEAVKTRLIEDMAQLQSVLWVAHHDLDSRKLALDVICTDVTKRMRSMEHKLTIADAKRVLGINPQQYRTMRQDFADVLREDHATSKTEAGPEHWEELKEKWRVNSGILRDMPDTSAAGKDKLRAIDVVARDVMKRLRDGQGNRHSPKTRPDTFSRVNMEVALDGVGREPHAPSSPNEGRTEDVEMERDFVPDSPIQYPRSSTPPILHSPTAGTGIRMGHESRHIQGQSHGRDPRLSLQHHQGLQINSALPQGPAQHHSSLLSDNLLSSGLPIDPQLSIPMIINTQGPNLGAQQSQAAFPLAQELPPNMSSTSHNTYVQSSYLPHSNPTPSVAVYLRLHPSSPITMAPPIWIATLTTRTLEELRQVACKDFAGTVCGRVEGILDREMTIEVSRDDELTAYLMVFEGRNRSAVSGPPCFFVQLLPTEWKT